MQGSMRDTEICNALLNMYCCNVLYIALWASHMYHRRIWSIRNAFIIKFTQPFYSLGKMDIYLIHVTTWSDACAIWQLHKADHPSPYGQSRTCPYKGLCHPSLSWPTGAQELPKFIGAIHMIYVDLTPLNKAMWRNVHLLMLVDECCQLRQSVTIWAE